jgi:hypothetical protein
MNTPIYNLLDLQYVKRWNMLGVTADDTVASHSFRVAMIAMAINKETPIPFDDAIVCKFALIHDVKECYTGDIATPTKAKILEYGVDVDKIIYGTPDEQSPGDGNPGYTWDQIKIIIKIADLMDMWHFLSIHGIGLRSQQCVAELYVTLIRAIEDLSGNVIQSAANKVLYEIQYRKKSTNAQREAAPEQVEVTYPWPVGY